MIGLYMLTFFVVFTALYAAGGQGHKPLKSWASPIVAASFVLLFLFLRQALSPMSVIGAILFLASSNGFSYGVKFTHNKIGLKILFRGLCGASWGICGLLIGIGQGHLILGVIQLILATMGSIVFGVLNPFPSKWGNWATIAEDICISLGYVILVPFMI